jgi:hypothetical protein
VVKTTTMVKATLSIQGSDDAPLDEFTILALTSENIIPFTLYTAYMGFSTNGIDYYPLTALNSGEFRRNYPLFTLRIPHILSVFDSLLKNTGLVDWDESYMEITKENNEVENFRFNNDTLNKCIDLLKLINSGFSIEEFNIHFLTVEGEVEGKVSYNDNDLNHRVFLASIIESRIFRGTPTFAGFRMVEIVSPNYGVTSGEVVALQESIVNKLHGAQAFRSVVISQHVFPLFSIDTYIKITKYFLIFALYPIRTRASLLCLIDRNAFLSIVEYANTSIHTTEILCGEKNAPKLTPAHAKALSDILMINNLTEYFRSGYASHLDRTAEEEHH